MKRGSISDLLPEGWVYILKSCSCQGSNQHEVYRNGKNMIKYFFKQEKYSYNNGIKKHISEIEADIKG